MKYFNLALMAVLGLSAAVPVKGQRASDCSGQNNRFPAPKESFGRCTDWEADVNQQYPNDFDGIFSQVKTYQCPESGKRIVVSNSIPDHDVTIWRNANPCEILMVVELPLDPENPDPNERSSAKTEIPIRGMVAIAKNGVPAFGPQESDGLNAVQATTSNRIDAGYWYGHPGGNNGWHVHNPQMGEKTVDSDTFLGWSMDGFQIFGPLSNDDVEDALDECNGLFKDGVYQYHVRTLDQVDEYAEYCDGDSPVTGWNYIFGCYSGDISSTRVVSSIDYDLPDDCVLEFLGSCTDNPEYFYGSDQGNTCDWIAEDPEDRCALDEEVMNECPAACTNTNCASSDNDNGDGSGEHGGEEVGENGGADVGENGGEDVGEDTGEIGDEDGELTGDSDGVDGEDTAEDGGDEGEDTGEVGDEDGELTGDSDGVDGEDTAEDGGDEGDIVRPKKLPNIIIIQPDDLIFMDDWGRPPYSGSANAMPGNGDDMPHIEDLRENGLQMMQAYTASPVCGTSRYSTITGKVPSRAASIRERWDGDIDSFPALVTIPSTKLMDTDEQNDCSEENLAAVFRASDDYETAMIGKWHLTKIGDEDYSYDFAVDEVKKCGFDHVGGLYIENLKRNKNQFNNYSDGTFSHNMEWITYEAIKIINETTANDKNFFMYFNPTVPHGSNSVKDAINDFSCQATADKEFEWPGDTDPWIKGMSEDAGCEAYRATISERSEASGGEYNLGPIWLDDAVGALVNALIDNGIYDDTIIVFQEDHGMDNKDSLYEGGIRIPQFIHYPAGIQPGTFNAPVSTVDLAPTLLEYAGIEQPYETDGKSWKQAVKNSTEEENWGNKRCLFFEKDQDRAIRCGCYKYIDIKDEDSGTWLAGEEYGLANGPGGLLFDLCDGGESYVAAFDNIREIETTDNESKQSELVTVLECHMDNTYPDIDQRFTDCSKLVIDEEVLEAATSIPPPVEDLVEEIAGGLE